MPLSLPANRPGYSSKIIKRLSELPPNVQGAIWLLVASVLFTLMAASIKAIGRDLPLSEVLFVRQSVMFIAALPVILSTLPNSIKTDKPLFHAARVSLALLAMTCGFMALRNLPIADVTALTFAKSFFVTIFAIVFLSEVVGIRRWSATIIGFVGVIIMLEPTSGVINGYSVLAIVSAAAAGLAVTLVRYLSRFDSPITILTYQTVFVGLACAPLAIVQWTPPNLEQWLLLIATGLLSVAAQTCNIRAFRAGEAGFLASLDYVRLLWAILIGLVVFSEIPAASTLAGAGLVIAAAVYTVHREARLGRVITRVSRERDFPS